MMDRRSFLRVSGSAVSTIGLAACGAPAPRSGPAPAPSIPAASGIFYPPPPAAPRIQYLATFAGEEDVVEKVSDFASFIVGDEVESRRLVQPYGVEMYDGRLYVVDTAVTGIVIFDLARHRLTTMLGTGGGAMRRPINVTIADDGTKYVCDTGRDQVLVFDESDRFVTAYGVSGQFKPVDCAIGADGRLYVVDIAHHQIHVLRLPGGETEFTFGRAGSEPGELFHPTNLSVGPGGDIYVVETSNFRVQRFTPRGEHIRFYGSIGDGPGHFARPKGIAVDRSGRLYVGDAAFENVQVFDNAGQLLLSFGNAGGGFAGLNLPAAVAVNYADIGLFTRHAATGFNLEHVIFVTSQFGPNKVDAFGFGTLDGADYSEPPVPVTVPAPPQARSPAGLEPRDEP